MSATYHCNICGKKMIKHQSEFSDYQFPYDGKNNSVSVNVRVDFNPGDDSLDICDTCAREAVISAVKQLQKDWKIHRV